MFILGVIPARGGSKGILNKNLRPLNGIPLIMYTIRESAGSLLGDVVISTDDPEIAKCGKSIIRPAELAQDDSPTLPAIQHAVAEYEKHIKVYGVMVDAVMILQPTSPLRLREDINNAIKQYLVSASGSLVSVCEGIHPVKSYDQDGKPFLPQEPYNKHKHRCLTRNGAIFITRRDLLDSGRIIGDSPLFYVMPKSRSIDIDDYEDLLITEVILSKGEIQ